MEARLGFGLAADIQEPVTPWGASPSGVVQLPIDANRAIRAGAAVVPGRTIGREYQYGQKEERNQFVHGWYLMRL